MGAIPHVLADSAHGLPPLKASAPAVQIPLPLQTANPAQPERPLFPLPPKARPQAALIAVAGRCLEKGCVFPATPGADGRCLHHQRQQREPALYCSHQPSFALVERSKYGPAKIEELEQNVSTRVFDRRRLMAERERFLGEQQ